MKNVLRKRLVLSANIKIPTANAADRLFVISIALHLIQLFVKHLYVHLLFVIAARKKVSVIALEHIMLLILLSKKRDPALSRAHMGIICSEKELKTMVETVKKLLG